jgi:hypothetical protein
MPLAWAAFLGTMVAISTLAVLGQATAVLLGGAENRLARLARRLPLRWIATLLAVVLAASVGLLVFGEDDFLHDLVGTPLEGPTTFARFVEHPVVRAILWPFTPWARAITAPDLATFLPWFGACAVIWLVAYELTARPPPTSRAASIASGAGGSGRAPRASTAARWAGACRGSSGATRPAPSRGSSSGRSSARRGARWRRRS